MSNKSYDNEQLVPDEIVQEYFRLRYLPDGIVDAKKFYFKHIMPLLRPWLEEQEEHKQLRDRKYTTLVSLMGFSPETTVQTTLILQPKKLIIVYNEEVKETADPAIRYLLEEEIISPLDYEKLEIDAFNPVNIYDRIFDRIPISENMVFDITGGTKVMSATAGALAWEKNLSLCYLQGIWDPQKGASGLREASKLTVFPNPSRSRGYRYRRDALRSYEQGNFISAAERFNESVQLIDNSFFDQLSLALCDCYCAFVDFDRERITGKIDYLEEILKIGGIRRLYQNQMDFAPHLNALRKFAKKPINLMATSAAFMELADLYAKQGRFDLAGLLSYRAMERFVEIGLNNISSNFKLEDPDWSLLTDNESSLRMEFAKLWRNRDDSLPRKVGLIDGFAILSILDENLNERFLRKKDQNALTVMMGKANKRNRSYLAHGVNNLNKKDSITLREGANDLAKAVLKDQSDELELLRSRLRPIELRKLCDDL